jgi:DNA mismatch repair protein MutL
VETRAIADVITALALANLSAGFSLESNGRMLLELPPARDLATRAADLWGDDFASALVPLSLATHGLELAGLVERPDAAVAGPRRVHLFVGGRPFRDRPLIQAAERGYRTTVPQGARPSFLLYLDLPPGGVDVNVHPTKAEVRFRDRAAVEAGVEQAVREALSSFESAATMDARPGLRPAPRPDGRFPDYRAAGSPASGPASPALDPGQLALFVSAGPGVAPEEREQDEGPDAVEETRDWRNALWQIHDSYILAETRSGLLIIDQHAAHERILFEALMRDFDAGGRPSQRLLFPITLKLSAAEYAVAEDSRACWRRRGSRRSRSAAEPSSSMPRPIRTRGSTPSSVCGTCSPNWRREASSRGPRVTSMSGWR